MTKIIFRILLIFGGLILLYITGKPLFEKVKFIITGESVEGRIIGFRGKGNSTAILERNTGRRNGKRTALRPVFRYPVIEGSIDSLDGRSSSGVLFSMANFELNDKVTVVFSKNHPENAYIFSKGIIFTDILLVLLSIFMMRMGFPWKSG